MKRFRAVDMPPKFRRTVKGRSTRLGESIYLSRFFSAYNLIYLKFFLMWVCCITLDFLIGFRFELLWPVWLLVRHLYESFRVHAFSSSLHYSAFSVFFVCVTATSDLVCYLFIPIQVLIFLASTYVWVQFVYQSSDRGVCLPSLFLWALFIVFEYSIRYRFDNATWYLTRTSWITAGLFPSTAESVSVGSSSTPSASSPRLELYRPFAAHCIGFPVVTLGFRVKSFFSNWRMRIRREEVRRQNEQFERVLADAIPTSFENRKHFISSRNHLSLEQDFIEYESAVFSTDLLNGLDANGHPRLYPNQALLAGASSSVALSSSPSQPNNPNSTSSSSLTIVRKQQQKLTARPTSSQMKQQNGVSTTKKNGKVGGVGWRTEANGGGHFAKKVVAAGRQIAPAEGHGPTTALKEGHPGTKIYRHALHLLLLALSPVAHLLTAVAPSFQPGLDGLLSFLRGNASQQDDMVSTSGDGSNVADEEEWDQESNCHFNVTTTAQIDHSIQQGTKKKIRRPRVLSSVSQTSTANDPTTGTGTGHSCATSQLTMRTAGSHSNSSIWTATTNGEMSTGRTGQQEEAAESLDSQSLVRENTQRNNELKQLQREKQTLEQSFEKLRGELKNSRNSEQELRSQLFQAQQQEQNSRGELKQLEREQKQKLDQIESKCKQLGKQNENFKGNIQALEKRVSELQLKKLEIERELANERLNSVKDFAGRQIASDSGEQFKLKLGNMDRELKALKRDMKTKDELCTKLESEIRQMHSANMDESKNMETLRQKNFLLEQTLSSENRLKQDLFRALNDSKAEIAALKAQLHAKHVREQSDMMNAFRDSSSNPLFHGTSGGGSSSGSSPTAHHQQQFPICQQKSLTPPPVSVGNSTFNLEQLLQATQNMSYSLGPISESNGTGNENNYANNFPGSGGTSSPYIGGAASEMLAVGGHRAPNSGGINSTGLGNGKSGN